MSRQHKRRLTWPLLLLFLAVFAVYGLNRLGWLPGSESANKAVDTAPAAREAYLGPVRSLAVLPLLDRSPAGDQGWFARGVAGELIHCLAGLDDFQVTAPVSAFFFRSGEGNPQVIAERLQAAYLLLGESELEGENVKLDVRLYDARRREVTWSGRFEQTTEQVFELLETLRAQIMENMASGDSEACHWRDPGDVQPWLAYLKGRDLLDPPTPPVPGLARVRFEEALQFAPAYAVARAGIAQAAIVERPPRIDMARASIEAALTLDPGLPEALALRSHIERTVDWYWDAAAATALMGLQRTPGDAGLMAEAARALFSAGQFEESVRYMSESLRRDPINLNSRLSLGLAQEFAGDDEGALSTYRQLLRLRPEFPAAHAFRARIRAIQEKPESALEESELENDEFWGLYARALALTAAAQAGQADNVLEEIVNRHGDHAAFQLAEIMAYRGDADAAFGWLETAWLQRDGGLAGIVGNRLLQALHDDPRWPELLSRLGLPLDAEGAND
jgi:TolB-like protein/thioredoxin-like negative regulator of GroEL